MNTSKLEVFKNLQNRQQIASLLGLTDKKLCFLLYKISKDLQYHTFCIPKKNGESRIINAPTYKLKIIQKELSKILYSLYRPKMCSYGFEINKNIILNAKQHIHKKKLLNIDLSNFFPSINFGRVRGMFLSSPFNFNKEVATVLAQICCYNNELPQGAPTSPVISNIICRKMDNDIINICKNLKCTYSRYADDISISTNLQSFPDDIFNEKESKVGNLLNSTIKKNGFSINETKIRLANNKIRQVVTGLVVNRKVNINRVYVRNIRALLHNWEKDGESICEQNFHAKFYSNSSKKPKLRNVLLGRINFIGQVRGKEDEIYIKLWNKYCKLVNKNDKIKQIIKQDDSIIMLIQEGESYNLEFKKSLEYSFDTNKCIKAIQYEKAGSNKKKLSPKGQILREITGFLNSTEGGTLLVGVNDDGSISGLAEDLQNCSRNNVDGLAQKLTQWLKNGDITPQPINKVHTKFYKISDKLIMKISIKPYPEPVYLNIGGQLKLYARNNVETKEIDTKKDFYDWIKANNKIYNVANINSSN